MIMQEIRKRQPLIHCLTNYVTANFTASGLLAAGASPVMADETREVAEMAVSADAVLLNIGTINTFTQESMIVAGMAANIKNIPVVLDPVGIGATSFRKCVAFEILEQVKIDLIRCNIGELAVLADCDTWQSRGVDSGEGDMDVIEAAKAVALKHKCIVAVTGVHDILTDGNRVEIISGGTARMKHVTGTGCLLGAFTAAALTLAGNKMENLKELLTCYKRIAENASKLNVQIGTFQVEILNQINSLSQELILYKTV